VHNGFVVFPFNGWHQELYRGRITADEVRWACNLMARLTDGQWHDAFKAGGYDPAAATRFITAIKARISQGQHLAPST
jgi:hypothetical protein